MRKILDSFLCRNLKFNNLNFNKHRKLLAVSLSVFYLASSLTSPLRTHSIDSIENRIGKNQNESNFEKFKNFIFENKIFLLTSLGTLAVLAAGFLIYNKNKIDEEFFDDGSPDKNISEIKQDLLRKAKKIKSNSSNFATKWDILCFLLGKNATNFVKENYPEWEERTKNISYWNKDRMDFALMSIAFSLRLAALENYKHDDKKNNELLIGENLPKVKLKFCNNNNNNLWKERLKKIIVEDDDILRSAHKFILNNPGFNSSIGFFSNRGILWRNSAAYFSWIAAVFGRYGFFPAFPRQRFCSGRISFYVHDFG